MKKLFAMSKEQGVTILLSSFLFAFAFPPFNFVVPALICLVPVAIYVARLADGDTGRLSDGGVATAKSAFKTGLFFGFLGYGANLYWIAVALLLFTKLAIAGFIASLIWLAPFIGLAFVVLFYARRTTRWPLVLLLPVVWVALEFLLNYLSDLSFPWLPLGLSVAHVPVLAQLADLSGVRGVSFWIAAVNGLLADAWLHRTDMLYVRKRLLAIIAVFTVVCLYGQYRMSTIHLSPIANIGIVQPNIEEHVKLNIADPSEHVGHLADMTRDLLQKKSADLIVWPEASLDRFLWQYPSWRDSVMSSVIESPTPLLIGMLDWVTVDSAKYKYYNAAAMTTPYGWLMEKTYRKYFLVPIVERVPFVNPDWFKRLDYFGGYSRGEDNIPFPYHFGGVGVMICYESIFPQLARAYAQQDAKVLANITNDAWFQRSTAPHQHFAHVILRAIENRLPVVRSANTGISAYVDPLGRIVKQTELFEETSDIYGVEGTSVKTVYTRFGDWLGVICISAATILFGYGFIRARR